MGTKQKIEQDSEVAQQIFDQFLQSLEDSSISKDVVTRLRKIFEKGSVTEKAIQDAIFGDD